MTAGIIFRSNLGPEISLISSLSDPIPTLRHELHIAILTRGFLRPKEGGVFGATILERFGSTTRERRKSIFI